MRRRLGGLGLAVLDARLDGEETKSLVATKYHHAISPCGQRATATSPAPLCPHAASEGTRSRPQADRSAYRQDACGTAETGFGVPFVRVSCGLRRDRVKPVLLRRRFQVSPRDQTHPVENRPHCTPLKAGQGGTFGRFVRLVRELLRRWATPVSSSGCPRDRFRSDHGRLGGFSFRTAIVP